MGTEECTTFIKELPVLMQICRQTHFRGSRVSAAEQLSTSHSGDTLDPILELGFSLDVQQRVTLAFRGLKNQWYQALDDTFVFNSPPGNLSGSHL